jgi:hypothetical protein
MKRVKKIVKKAIQEKKTNNDYLYLLLFYIIRKTNFEIRKNLGKLRS